MSLFSFFGINPPQLKAERAWIVIIFFSSIFFCISLRLVYVSLRPLSAHARSDFCIRAPLTDRQGHVLAGSLLTYALYAHPEKIKHPKEVIRILKETFPFFKEDEMMTALKSSKKFVWIARHLTPEQKMQFEALGIEGMETKKDYKRLYIHDRLFSHIIGTADIDMQGTSGLEKFFNNRLNTDPSPVQLSLDLRVQYIVYDALMRQMEDIHAEAANAILMNVQTGEILAMVSLPDFSPQKPIKPTDPSFFNRNISGIYEFGSIMKIHNNALFLSSKKGTLHTLFPGSPFFIGRKRIADYQGKNRTMSVLEGFIYSSNIVNAHMAEMVGREGQKNFFTLLGFNKPLKIELCEWARPLLPKDNSRITLATLSYGYGIAITPLHMITSLAALVSGFKVKPTLLRAEKTRISTANHRLIDAKIVESIRFLMEQAVINGQAKKAATESCRVGAKTGTANLLDKKTGKRREKENLTTCVAAFPIQAPQYVLFVSFEKGKSSAKTFGHATAGWFAAPVVKDIVEQISPLLGLLNPLESEKNDLTPP